jgi:hypothetical protein
MIIVIILGSILLSINLMLSKYFIISNTMLNAFLIPKFTLFNLIGRGVSSSPQIFFAMWYFTLCFHIVFSCRHTSQQNGAAGRKHRHIVETGLALLAHSSLPVCFWDETFLTACYHLINRMPSRTIHNASPLA